MFTKLYSNKEIRKALDCYSRFQSFRKAEKVCGIGKSTIQRWWQSFFSLSLRSKVQKKKARKKRTPKYQNIVLELDNLFRNTNSCFLSLKSIVSQLSTSPSISWLSSCLKKTRVTRKRFVSTKVNTKSPEQMGLLFSSFQRQLDKYADNELVSLDETGFCNIGNVSYGYCKKGNTIVPNHVSRRKKLSVVMAIHPIHGVVSYKSSIQPFCKESFLSFLNDVFLPSLPCGVKGVILDNVAFHKSKGVVELLNNHGIECLYIPPYSPRCNPIEEVFSVLKRSFRSHYMGNNSFEESVNISLHNLNLYKGLSLYYTHTRKYVSEQCLSRS